MEIPPHRSRRIRKYSVSCHNLNKSFLVHIDTQHILRIQLDRRQKFRASILIEHTFQLLHNSKHSLDSQELELWDYWGNYNCTRKKLRKVFHPIESGSLSMIQFVFPHIEYQLWVYINESYHPKIQSYFKYGLSVLYQLHPSPSLQLESIPYEHRQLLLCSKR